MGHLQRLFETDICDLIRLVREACELGYEPFGGHERKVLRTLQTLQTELAAIGQARDVATPPLPRRLEQVMAGLKRGLSEKEVASELGISKHTVHDYVKELHRRFGVTSRFELIQKE
jgi:DNA-binding NarL/FixJ family response regulator